MNEQDCYMAALGRVESADLPPAEYRTIRRLLDIAAQTNGYLEINRERAMRICGTEAWGTVRRHLIALQAAGVIQKWLNHSTRVWFVDYPPPNWMASADTERAEVITLRADLINLRSPGDDDDGTEDGDCSRNDQICALDDHFRAQDEQKRASDDQIRAKNDGGNGLGWEYIPNDPDQGNGTQPNPHPDETLRFAKLRPDQLWAFRVITDPEVGIIPANAAVCVKHHTAAYVVKQVAAWWAERETVGVGALHWRLMNPGRYKPGQPSAEFLSSPLYRRHYPLSPAQVRARSYSADPPPVASWIEELPPPIYDEGGDHAQA